MYPAAETSRLNAATGSEWLIDASGCRPDALRSIPVFAALFERVVADLDLRPVRPAVWHQFPGESGLTGLLLLSESHLACHTFPERGFAAINLYCCRERPDWPWARELAGRLGARDVTVRRMVRGTPPGPASTSEGECRS
jgi:S-adenosylmethionine decarboxylase